MDKIEPFEIDCPELKKRLDSDDPPAILDVREPWETDLGMVVGAIAIPMGEVSQHVGELPRDRSLAVMCHHGGRSAQVTAWLRGQGFSRAMNVFGGIDAWSRLIDPDVPRY